MAIHRDLPDSELHEPKGASSAEEGMVYRADGSGSGSWTYHPQGFGLYNHSSGINQTVTSTPTKLIIDHQDTSLVETGLPREMRGVSSFWDNDNSRFTPVAIGDSYVVSIDIPIISETDAPREFFLTVDVGNGQTITAPVREELRATGRTPPYDLYFVFPTAILTNAGLSGFQFFVNTDRNSVLLGNPGIGIQRVSSGDF